MLTYTEIHYTENYEDPSGEFIVYRMERRTWWFFYYIPVWSRTKVVGATSY